MKKKLYFFFLLGGLASVNLFADDNALLVWTKSGEKIAYLLDDYPVVTFSEEGLVLTTRQVQVIYPIPNLLRFTHVTVDNTGVNELLADSICSFSVSGDVLQASSLLAGDLLSVYTSDGVLVASGMADAGG